MIRKGGGIFEKVVDEANETGGDYKNYLMYAKRWDFCIKYKYSLSRDGYSVKFSVSDGKKFVWEVVKDRVVNNIKDNAEIVL